MKNEEAELSFCHTESRKKSQRSQKAKEAAIRLKGCKGERMNAEAWRSVLAAQWRKSKSLQHLVFPGGLPIQVLTRPRPCLASEIGRDRACSGWYGRKQNTTLKCWLFTEDTPGVYFWKILKNKGAIALCFIGIKLSQEINNYLNIHLNKSIQRSMLRWRTLSGSKCWPIFSKIWISEWINK